MQKAVERIMHLFRGSSSAHGTHGEPELDPGGVKWAIKKTARTLKGAPTEAMWLQHLTGKRPLGVITIRDDSNAAWGSIDIDQYDVDELDVIKRIEAAKYPLVPCRSKSGGLHLFLFCKEPLPAEEVQGALRDIAAALGFAGSEIFPKQTKVFVEKGDQGNWMVMPYFGGDYNGKLRFQYGLKKTGAEMTLEEFLTYAEKHSLTADQLTTLRAFITVPPGAEARTSGRQPAGAPREPYSNGPPCLQHLAKGGFPEGGRNNALFHIGVYLRRAFPDDWQKKLEEDNFKYMKPPLPSDEVQEVIRSLTKREYEYKCKDQPMAAHCQSVICRARKYGVGAGGAYPVIESMAKLETEPALWFVQIPGKRIYATTEQLQNYRKFHGLCMEYASVTFRMMADKDWYAIVGEAMQNHTQIEVPPEATHKGQFQALLNRFLTNRAVSDKREDLLRDVPWADEEGQRYVFTLESIQQFMKRENVKIFDHTQITRRLREDVAGKAIAMDVKGHRNKRVWEVPASAIEKAEELDAPTKEEEII